jgi:hypothetical protein
VSFQDVLPSNDVMEEEIYAHNPEEQNYALFESELNKKDDIDDDRFLAGEKFNFDNELEFELHKEAQRQLGSEHPNDIVRKDNTLGKEYRGFEDRRTGDHTIIEVEHVKDRLEKVLNSGREGEFSQMDVSAAPQTSIPAARARDIFNFNGKTPNPKDHSERHGYNLRKRARKNTTPEKLTKREVNRRYRAKKRRWLNLK